MYKLLILTSYYHPEQISSSHLENDLIEAYNKVSFKRVIFTPSPCRGISVSDKIKYKTIKYEERYDGLEIIHRFSMFDEKTNSLQRALRYLLCSIIQLWKGCFSKDSHNIDVIITGSTPPILGAFAALVARKTRKPLIYILQDIFPDSLVAAGFARKGGILWKIGRFIENFTYDNSSRIIVISEDFRNNLLAKGVRKEKIEIVYNWIDATKITPIKPETNPLFKEFGISTKTFNVVYAGNLGNAQNVMLLIQAALILKTEKDIMFYIFGTGGKELEIRNAVLENNLDNVHIYPLQPVSRVSQVYSLGNACVVACKPGFGGSAMPSKTWSIMATGRAVLASFDEGELKSIIENNNCGVYTSAGDIDNFSKSILYLKDNINECLKMGNNGRNFVLNNLTKEIGTQKYVDIIKSVASYK